jgi:palmitoyl transferase
MTPHLKVLLALLLAVTTPLAAGEELSRGWSQALDSINSTTPTAIASAHARDEGWFSGVWDGAKRIWNEGSHDLYLSGYVWHMPYGWSAERRSEFNDNAWGVGYGRTLTDGKSNQRMLFAIVASDSYKKPMVLAGYAWLARWPLAEEMHVGAGYSALIVRHESTFSFPFPVAAPVVSVGGDHVTLYATYINNMTYFFGKVSFR